MGMIEDCWQCRGGGCCMAYTSSASLRSWPRAAAATPQAAAMVRMTAGGKERPEVRDRRRPHDTQVLASVLLAGPV